MSYEPFLCKNIPYPLWTKNLLFANCISAIFLLFSKMHYKLFFLVDPVAFVGPLDDHNQHIRSWDHDHSICIFKIIQTHFS